MNFNEYQQLAMRTSGNKGGPQSLLLNAALGLAGETGEFIDHVKKHLFHGHSLDNSFLIKELGDVMWYIAQAATGLGISLEEIAETNIDKLKKRYPSGFTTQASIERSE